MLIEVKKVEPLSEGEEVVLTFSFSDGEGKSEERKILLSAVQYYELGMPRGEIDEEKYELAESFGKKHKAVRQGMNILSYGDNTKAQLVTKLRAKGIDAESAKEAAAELEKKGYIDEKRYAERAAEMCIKKGYGKKRISAYLMSHGISAKCISELEILENTDFCENCRKVIEKKWGELPSEQNKKEREKAIRFLLNYGYSFDEIRNS